MRRIAGLATVLGGAMILAACGGAAQTPASSASGPPDKVVIGYGAPVGEQLVPVFAQDQGLFQKYHLDATVQQLANASQVIPGLKSGEVNFDVMASPQPEEGAAAGVELKWLSVWNSKPDLQIIAAPGIKSAQDLKGKTLGLSSTGSTTGVMMIDYLQKNGLSTNDVHLVPLGSVGAQAQSFIAGQISAFVAGPPITQTVLQKRSGATILADLTNEYQWTGAGLVAYMPWVQAHKQAAANVVKAMNEAWAKWKSSPSEAQATIQRVTNSTPDAAQAAYQGSIASGATSLTPSVALETKVLAVLVKQLPDTAKLKASDMVDTEFSR